MLTVSAATDLLPDLGTTGGCSVVAQSYIILCVAALRLEFTRRGTIDHPGNYVRTTWMRGRGSQQNQLACTILHRISGW